jgi:CO dehydrogenase/acetyl-CoA synthase gamma subunit (corrinoid Fe-S protein)
MIAPPGLRGKGTAPDADAWSPGTRHGREGAGPDSRMDKARLSNLKIGKFSIYANLVIFAYPIMMLNWIAWQIEEDVPVNGSVR